MMAFRPFYLAILTVGGALIALLPASAQNEGKSYDHLLRRYDYEVEVKAITTLNQLLTPQEYAEQIDEFDFPVLPPARTVDEINEMIDSQVSRVVEEKYPSARKDEILREAERKYRLYQKGDFVSVRATLRGVDKTMEGTLYMITPDNIKLGDDLLSTVDIHPDDQAHFNRELREQAIETYVKINTRRFTEARNAFEKEQRAEITEFIFKRNGYYYVKSRKRWFPEKIVFEALYNKRRNELYKEKLPSIQYAVYESYGWLFDEETDRWVPPPELLEERTTTTTTAASRSKLDQSVMMLRSIADEVFAQPDKQDEGTAPDPLNLDEGADLFDEAPDKAEDTGAQTPPAENKPAVDDLYDE